MLGATVALVTPGIATGAVLRAAAAPVPFPVSTTTGSAAVSSTAGAVLTALAVLVGSCSLMVLLPAHAKATCSLCCCPRAQSRAAMGFFPLGCTRVSSTA